MEINRQLFKVALFVLLAYMIFGKDQEVLKAIISFTVVFGILVFGYRLFSKNESTNSGSTEREIFVLNPDSNELIRTRIRD